MPVIEEGTRGAVQIIEEGGKTKITASQSWLGTLGNCPEQARRDYIDPAKYRVEGVSAFVGTQVHEVLDRVGQMWKDDFDYFSGMTGPEFMSDLYGESVKLLDSLVTAGFYDCLQTKEEWWTGPEPTSASHVKAMLDAKKWLAEGLKRLGEHLRTVKDPDKVRFEETGHKLFMEGDGWEFWLHGTCDILLPKSLVDWKTGMAYKKWECERHKLQHLVYAYLFDRQRFVYEYIATTGAAGTVKVDTFEKDIDRLALVCEGAVQMILNSPPGESSWMPRPDGWWCSEKWCSSHAMGECVGATRTLFPKFRTKGT